MVREANRLTERNCGKEMMGDVIVRDVVEEETTNPAQERAIDSGSSSTKESPLLVAVMRYGRIGVLEVREHDDPVVGQLQRKWGWIPTLEERRTHEKRDEVELGEVRNTDLARIVNKNRRHSGNSDIRRNYLFAFIEFEKRGRRVEVLI
jgi:hypothetical protein